INKANATKIKRMGLNLIKSTGGLSRATLTRLRSPYEPKGPYVSPAWRRAIKKPALRRVFLWHGKLAFSQAEPCGDGP
ncbi:MAG: hypothetical protein Q7U75_05310, partial [Desulfobacterales bacterium]|nr:hypothetical protein [Desulfobacterales bacterium]